jgi:hypothetical protein
VVVLHRLAQVARRLRCVLQHTGRPYGPVERIPETAWRDLSFHGSPRAALLAIHRCERKWPPGTGRPDEFRVLALWRGQRYEIVPPVIAIRRDNPYYDLEMARCIASSPDLARALGLSKEARYYASFWRRARQRIAGAIQGAAYPRRRSNDG